MKQILLLLLLGSTVTVNSQSLKDLLYSGKLKNDTGVVRKSDDLSAKIDTSSRKTVDTLRASMFAPQTAPAADGSFTRVDTTGVAVSGDAPAGPNPKDNEDIWKYYMESFLKDLQTEVSSNKKIKEGTYQVLVVYEIGTDGYISVTNVAPAPQSDNLAEAIRNRMRLTAPKLNPVLASNGQPRKMIRKYSFNITKK